MAQRGNSVFMHLLREMYLEDRTLNYMDGHIKDIL